MSKICICGAFRLWDKPKGGQEIKTVILSDYLESQYGEVYKIDTLAKTGYTLLPFQLIKALLTCSDIIILPAQNGLVVISQLLVLLNYIFHRKLHYVVIGGWLHEYIPLHPKTEQAIKMFKGIYVETNIMKESLNQRGFSNVSVVPNFKQIKIITESLNKTIDREKIKLCTFSRVTETKGIESAIIAVINANKVLSMNVFELDIYGPIDEEDRPWFQTVLRKYDKYKDTFSYCGLIPFTETTHRLSSYDALIFPTFYEGEGFAGTVVDAMGAGLPVLATKWHSNGEIIKDGLNGKLFEPKNEEQLAALLLDIYRNPDQWMKMRTNCLKQADKYLPSVALTPLTNNLAR